MPEPSQTQPAPRLPELPLPEKKLDRMQLIADLYFYCAKLTSIHGNKEDTAMLFDIFRDIAVYSSSE